MTRGGSNPSGVRSARPAPVPRILSREDCDAIFKRVCAFGKGGGVTRVEFLSWWQGETRWGRNRVSLASDRREVSLSVERTLEGGMVGWATTNQLDDASIEGVVRAAERLAEWRGTSDREPGGSQPKPPEYQPPEQKIWSDATYNLTTEERANVARKLVEPAEAKELLSAGYIEVRAGSEIRLTSAPETRAEHDAKDKPEVWERPYVAWTQAHCSMTVRNQKGTGSGWAGVSSFDWNRINAAELTERALRKCLASQDPVALEPGRYTVILEPEAVADLCEEMMKTFGSRPQSEWVPTDMWYLKPGYSMIGLKVVDERITISQDPRDPDLGIVMPRVDMAEPVAWIEKGVLTHLGYDFNYALEQMDGRNTMRGVIGYRMSGGSTSVEEMIRTTKRGLLVTRFTNIPPISIGGGPDGRSLVTTGLTRDGLWLIEDGKITKAVKNMRFTDSPLFMLNSIEQLGEPVRVFRPTRKEGGQLIPAVVPPIKARDFSFTAMVDAV